VKTYCNPIGIARVRLLHNYNHTHNCVNNNNDSDNDSEGNDDINVYHFHSKGVARVQCHGGGCFMKLTRLSTVRIITIINTTLIITAIISIILSYLYLKVLRVYDVTDAAATALVVARTVAKGAQACEKAGGEEEDVLSSLLLAVRVHGMGVNDLSVCACHGSCKSGSCDLPTSAFVQAAKMEGAKVETAKMEVAKVGAAKMEVAKMGATGRRVRVGTGGDDQGVSLLELEIFGAGPEWQVRVVRGLRLECVHGAAVRGVRLR